MEGRPDARTATWVHSGPAFDAPPSTLCRGDRVGDYVVLGHLGTGGFAEVFLAEQTEPVRRRVALKLVLPYRNTHDILARFRLEQQALASMRHPNVAKVFDAGATETGRAYFVMEYVPGTPITTHCERYRLGVDARIELFVQACSAIQHAHQNGVIHRDVSSANVLVAAGDTEAQVKVIDFGVAKAIDQYRFGRDIFTEFGMLVGTPEYMSPEQADVSPDGVDTRTDVYALGVLLYELLVGALPFDSRTLRSQGDLEMRRIIREDEPPKPSARLSDLGPASDDIAATLGTDPSSLARRIMGDLDWITMKAMDKDRTRRYDSVSALAEDLRRHLRDEPVVAGPPSAAYRVGKFVRRHRGGVIAGSLVALSLCVGTVTSTVFGLGQHRARQQEALRARETSDALRVIESMIGLIHPYQDGSQRSLTEALMAAEQVTLVTVGEPTLEASIRTSLSAIYMAINELDAAETHLTRAVEIREARLDRDDPALADTLFYLGWLRYQQGRHAEAGPIYRRSLSIRERALGARDELVAETCHGLGLVYAARDADAEAERLFRRAIAILPEGHRLLHQPQSDLAELLAEAGRLDEARPLADAAVATAIIAHGRDNPAVAFAMRNRAFVLRLDGRLDEAADEVAGAIEIIERSYGSDGRVALGLYAERAVQREQQGRYDEAADDAERLRSMYRASRGSHHAYTRWARRLLARTLVSDPGRAEALFQEMLEAAIPDPDEHAAILRDRDLFHERLGRHQREHGS